MNESHYFLNGSGAESIQLPLVSIVITNYNYGRYLRGAFESVRAQTYPNIECVIVDDASTDESGAVLDEIARRDSAVRIIRRKTNAGQTEAFNTGFAASSGEYVVFLDADDLLLPDYVTTHVFVHLSLRAPVGFTSSNMLQTSGSRVVTACCNYHFNAYVASRRGVRDNFIRRIDLAAPGLWRLKLDCAGEIERLLHFVDPKEFGVFVFAQTSGNCFRRDALRYFLGEGKSMALKFHGDTYLNKGVSLLNGAVLIDIPLAVYRVHGANGFARHPELFGVMTGDAMKNHRADHFAWRAIADRLIGDDEILRSLGAEGYRTALLNLQRSYSFDPQFPQFEDLTGYLETELRKRARAVEGILGHAGFQYVLGAVKSECRSASRGRLGPRVWLKPLAEGFLTFGRLLAAERLTAIGERLWRL